MARKLLIAALMAVSCQLATADILTEDFEAAFPNWESGWFGTNSNAQNYYGIGQGRGNNPDGLWIADGSFGQNIRVVFNSPFALSLTALSLDVAGFSPTRLEFFDAGNNVLSDVAITLTSGAFTDPGTYVNYSVTSASGIGGFRFHTGSPLGNTSIDNVVATRGAAAVPEPATWLSFLPLLAIGLHQVRIARRR